MLKQEPDDETLDETQLPEDDVLDEADTNADEFIPEYTMVSYGADFDVAGLVKRLQDKEILIPAFQREFVWTRRQASRFIESLLMGLPVPGIFLWRDPETKKFTVVDGHQRLKTLQFFTEGILRGREFVLPEKTSPYQRMQPRFQKRAYKTLDDEDRRTLDNTIIHATIVNQEHPPADDSSIFYLFERLNTEGTPLAAEEIRSAVYQGSFIALLAQLNQNRAWRALYGDISPRMKDRELIARFFALYYNLDSYARPMKEFLNRYYGQNRDLRVHSGEQLTAVFTATIQCVFETIGPRAFRPVKALNAAVFDAVMIAVSRRLEAGPVREATSLSTAYDQLLANADFQAVHSRSTADADNVKRRISIATHAFSSVP